MHTEQYDPWQTGTSCCQPPFAPSSPQSDWIASYREAVATSLADVIKVRNMRERERERERERDRQREI
jgi:hypothetical protein